MVFVKGRFNKCPVDSCTGGGREPFGRYRHFCLIHPDADIIINQDGKIAKCQLSGIRVVNMNTHINSYTCRKGQERRRNEIRQDRQVEAENITFSVNGRVSERY